MQTNATKSVSAAGKFTTPAISAPWLQIVILSFICFFLVLTLSGFGASLHWMFDNLDAFRLYWALGLCLLSVLCLLSKHVSRFHYFALGFIAALLSGLSTYWTLYGQSAREQDPPTPATGASLRIVSFNVHTANPQKETVQQYLQSLNADLILLLEINADWVDALAWLRASHPYRHELPREDNFGIALYSRLPMQCRTLNGPLHSIPSVLAEVQHTTTGRKFHVLSTHPPPPIGARLFAARNEQFAFLTRVLEVVPEPRIVMGDLNATPWSPFLKRFVRENSLGDVRRNRLLPTWNAFSYWLKLPLDYILVSTQFSVSHCTTGPTLGSDHLSMIAELKLDWPEN